MSVPYVANSTRRYFSLVTVFLVLVVSACSSGGEGQNESAESPSITDSSGSEPATSVSESGEQVFSNSGGPFEGCVEDRAPDVVGDVVVASCTTVVKGYNLANGEVWEVSDLADDAGEFGAGVTSLGIVGEGVMFSVQYQLAAEGLTPERYVEQLVLLSAETGERMFEYSLHDHSSGRDEGAGLLFQHVTGTVAFVAGSPETENLRLVGLTESGEDVAWEQPVELDGLDEGITSSGEHIIVSSKVYDAVNGELLWGPPESLYNVAQEGDGWSSLIRFSTRSIGGTQVRDATTGDLSLDFEDGELDWSSLELIHLDGALVSDGPIRSKTYTMLNADGSVRWTLPDGVVESVDRVSRGPGIEPYLVVTNSAEEQIVVDPETGEEITPGHPFGEGFIEFDSWLLDSTSGDSWILTSI